jgi:hypothetical protein
MRMELCSHDQVGFALIQNFNILGNVARKRPEIQAEQKA